MKKLVYLSCALLMFSAQQAMSADEDGVSVNATKRQSSAQRSGAYLGSQQKWTTNRQARIHAYRDADEAVMYEKEKKVDNETNRSISTYEAQDVGSRQKVSTGTQKYDDDAVAQVTMPYVVSDKTANENETDNDVYRPLISTYYERNIAGKLTGKTRKQIDYYRALDAYTYPGEFFTENIQGETSQSQGYRISEKYDQAETHLYVKGSNYEGRLGAHDGRKTPDNHSACNSTDRTARESEDCKNSENPLFIDKPKVGTEYQLIYANFVDVLRPGSEKAKTNLTKKNFVIIDGSAHGTGATFLTADRQVYTLGTSSVREQAFKNSYFSTNTSPNTRASEQVETLAPNRLAYIGGIRTTGQDLQNARDAVLGENIIPYRVTNVSFGPIYFPVNNSLDWFSILGAVDHTNTKIHGVSVELNSTRAAKRQFAKYQSSKQEDRLQGHLSDKSTKVKAIQFIDIYAINDLAKDSLSESQKPTNDTGRVSLLAVGDDSNVYKITSPVSNGTIENPVLTKEDLSEHDNGEIFVEVKGFTTSDGEYVIAKSSKNRLYIRNLKKDHEKTTLDNVGKFCTNHNWGMYTKLDSEGREISLHIFSGSSNKAIGKGLVAKKGDSEARDTKTERIFDIACGVNHGLYIAGTLKKNSDDKRTVKGFGSNSHFQLTNDTENLENMEMNNKKFAKSKFKGEWVNKENHYKDGDIVYYNGALWRWRNELDDASEFHYTKRDFDTEIVSAGELGSSNAHPVRVREWMELPYGMNFDNTNKNPKHLRGRSYGTSRPQKEVDLVADFKKTKNALKNYEPGNLADFAKENEDLMYGNTGRSEPIYKAGELVWLDYHGGKTVNAFKNNMSKHKILWFVSNYGYSECVGNDCYTSPDSAAVGYELITTALDKNGTNDGLIAAGLFKKCRRFNVAAKEETKISGNETQGKFKITFTNAGMLPGPLNKNIENMETMKYYTCNNPIAPWSEVPPFGWERITDGYVEFEDDFGDAPHPYPYPHGEILYFRDIPYILSGSMDTKDYKKGDYNNIGVNSPRNFFIESRTKRLETEKSELQPSNYTSRAINSRKETEANNNPKEIPTKTENIWNRYDFGVPKEGGTKLTPKEFYEKYFIIRKPVVVYKAGNPTLAGELDANRAPDELKGNRAEEATKLEGVPVRVFAGLNSTYVHTIKVNKK